GNVRVIGPDVMPGRLTAIARHLTDPANMVYYYDMEGMVYEANVRTLAVKKLFHKPVPGWHGKGAYTSQGRLVVANNGGLKVGSEKADYKVQDVPESPENAGVLAQWDGTNWSIVERRQFTDVTGPGGIYGNDEANDRLWAIGWDKRSLRLKLLEGGDWYTYLLPKATFNNDAVHGWFTEWPRIREITGGRWMMDMHGMFFDFSPGFSKADTSGISPVASHLRYIPDFCDWNEKLVIATDETSIQGNPMAGQPQSNLWFGSYDNLKEWGPASGFGGPWVNDSIKANVPSDPFLVKGFKRRVVHLKASGAGQVAFTFEVDRYGSGDWKTYKTLKVGDGQYAYYIFDEDFDPCWIRVKVDKDCTATVYFHLTDDRYHNPKKGRKLFAGLADIDRKANVSASLIYPAKRNRNLRVIRGERFYEFTREGFAFEKDAADAKLKELVKIDHKFSVDQASVILTLGNKDIPEQYLLSERLRLPKGSALYDKPVCGAMRMEREVESERILANVHGTFYEVPLYHVGKPSLWSQVRPVSSHNKQIYDFTTWNGLLVLSGVDLTAKEDGHVFKSEDGSAGLWFGGIDDLWKLGKPVGVGGPWKDSSVTAGDASDPYLMTGYDKKTLELTADKDTMVTVEVDIDHQTGWHVYKSFKLKAGRTKTHVFPEGFSAHWIRVRADRDCRATAWFRYE
ncbi:MAG: hypothetical protein KAS23_08780, partial [Anaerohalosphaera sp.]|nr:hypothetical protein [Anaerohalosphaera sp.]